MKMFNYDNALKYLNDLARFGINLGLERMNIILNFLGNPHKELKCVHVAGTNGKGSISSMIANGLTNSGYRVGRYTSPHLISYRERFTIDGQDISEKDFATIICDIKTKISTIEELKDDVPTEFEVLTAAAFMYFYRQNVDICVIEVGLGGRFDATNVLEPVLSVITNIGLDHMDRLGNTLQEIAGEKCGIIKKSRPVVSSLQQPEALSVIEHTAIDRGSKLVVLGRDVSFTVKKEDENGFFITVDERDVCELKDVYVPLAGRFQHENAACAMVSLWKLRDEGFVIPEEGIRKGFGSISIPGRLEIIKKHPYLVFDVGHNEDASRYLRESIEQLFSYERLIMVTGLLKDKDVKGYIRNIAGKAHVFIATMPTGSRALPPEELAAVAREYTDRVLTIKDPEKAMEKAMDMAGSNDLVLMCGSFYLIGFMRKKIFCHKYTP